MYTEVKELQGVRYDKIADELVASWITRLMRDDVEVNARLDHISYFPADKQKVIDEVPSGQALVDAMGWV